MKVLLTGATGFIGRNLLDILLENYDVHAVYHRRVFKLCPCLLLGDYLGLGNFSHSYADLSNSSHVKELIDKVKPDIIIHLASHSTTKLDEDNPAQIIDSNIKSTYNIAHYAPKNCKIIFASSIVVYGNFNKRRSESSVCTPISIYGITKLTSEQILDIEHDNMAILRICATVGPLNTMTHGIVHDFARKLKLESEYLEVLGDSPGSIKPFIHIDDVKNMILEIVNKDIIGTFNVCPHDEISVEEVALAVMQGLNIYKPIKWLGQKSMWKGDNPIIQCYNDKLRSYGVKPLNSYDAILKACHDSITTNR